jgi:hypothetical protein
MEKQILPLSRNLTVSADKNKSRICDAANLVPSLRGLSLLWSQFVPFITCVHMWEVRVVAESKTEESVLRDR